MPAALHRSLALLTLLAATSPATAQPANQPEPAPLPEPTAPAEPVLSTMRERHWTLSLRFRAFPGEILDRREFRPGGQPRSTTARGFDRAFEFNRAVVVAPIIEGTATHRPLEGGILGSLRFDFSPAGLDRDDVVDDEPTLLPGYQNGERLARWDAFDIEDADQMRLWIDIPMVCRSVDFDEARAREIGWPKGPWPAICATALTPQLGIDPANEDVVEMVIEVLGPKPYDDPPSLVAKKLAAAVIDRFQPSGLGFEYERDGRFAGIDLQLEVETSEEMSGSPADMVALYVAACRAAGLPARPIIGYDLYSSPEGVDEELTYLPSHCGVRFQPGDITGLPRLTYWAEFALYNEAANTLEWVPVDVLSQRRVSSRPRPIDRPWLFFGSHPCAEALLPISHHFFPPTTVVGMGAPLLWGWMAEPEIAELTQTLRVWAQGTPVTTGQQLVVPEK